MSEMRLNNDDSCAVDLILDRDSTRTPGDISSCFSIGGSQVIQERLAAVEHLLHGLGQFRAEEPAPDLVARTMARCDQAAQANKATRAHPAHPSVTARPLA
jgi:hypothetical protein